MAGRFARSLELAGASWSVVKADKELLLLPVLSVAALLVILGSLAVPGGFPSGAAGGEPGGGPVLGALLFYVVAYFITLFFNTALVGAALMRMNGENPTLGDGLRIAWQRAGRIFGYACIAATVGLLLRSLEERVGWTLATFLVVPVSMTAIQSGSATFIALVVAVGVLSFFTLSALHATMQGVYSAALYRYATEHTTPLPGFGPELLEQAFGPKS